MVENYENKECDMIFTTTLKKAERHCHHYVKLMLLSILLDKSMEILIQKMVDGRELIFILVLNSQVSLPVFCCRAGDRGKVCSSLFWAWLLQRVGH
jgi:hypothetical protein